MTDSNVAPGLQGIEEGLKRAQLEVRFVCSVIELCFSEPFIRFFPILRLIGQIGAHASAATQAR